MRNVKDQRGLSLIEVLIASAILAVGLLALLSAFPIGYVDVNVSGGQSKATAYAQQMMERLKNLPFQDLLDNPAGNDTPEVNYTRTWNICPVGDPSPSPCFDDDEDETLAPNRLVRIQVTVAYTGGGRPQTVRLDSMRAE